jgi:hypothetical protein
MALPPPVEDRSKRPTYEQLVERCRRDGLNIGPKVNDGPLSAEAFQKKYGVSCADFNLLPDAPLPRNWR